MKLFIGFNQLHFGVGFECIYRITKRGNFHHSVLDFMDFDKDEIL